MTIEYGQFCPVAKAAEILGERWTLLVVRELLLGTTRFSDLQKALPKASPTILAKRLKELQTAGLIRQRKATALRRADYQLTRSGQALAGVIEQIGTWAERWAPSRLAQKDLDEYFLMLDSSRRMDLAALPLEAATIGVRLRASAGEPHWWLVVRDGRADLCDRDPGFEIDLLVSGPLRAVVGVWLGRESLHAARRAGTITVTGNAALARSMERWLGYSAFARGVRA